MACSHSKHRRDAVRKLTKTLIQKFIDYIRIERRYSALTVRDYERDLREFCSFLHVKPEDWEPRMVTTEDVRAWMIALMDEGKSPRTVRRKVSTLHSFWRFLLRVGYLEVDITHAVVLPKMDKPLPHFFREQEMREVTQMEVYGDDFPSIRDNVVIAMLYQTGMRRAELMHLKDGDINLQQRTVRIFGKRAKERIVPFGEGLLRLIEQYLEVRREQFGIESSPAQPFLLTNPGNPMNATTLYNIVRTRMGEVTTQQKHSPHVLRHTFATTMLEHGADIHSIQLLLGHASLASTQVYTHTTFEQLKKAYEKAHPRSKGGGKG